MSKFLNDKYQKLQAYTPGEQPQDMEYLKLNTNESPFPPSPKVLDAINSQQASLLRLYSDPECKALRTALAKLYDVDIENVYLSNGSDDILNFAFMAFADKEVSFPEISYGFYKVFADLYGLKANTKELKPDFSIQASDYYNQEDLVVIANPNAPTGVTLSLDEIEEILKTNPNNVVVIDEAYVDFGADSAVPLTKKYPNLLVVQTFSKSRSMAGARLGFAIADKQLIDDLNRIKYSTNPYNVNRLTLVAGEAAVNENDYYVANCRSIIEARDYTTKAIEELGFYVVPSKANFIFAKCDKIDGKELYDKLKERGILVRHFTTDKIKEYNRITIGTLEQMKKFVSVVNDILEE